MKDSFYWGGAYYLVAIVGLLCIQLLASVIAVAVGGVVPLLQYAAMACISAFEIVLVFVARKRFADDGLPLPALASKPTAKNAVLSLAVSLLAFVGSFPIVCLVQDALLRAGVPAATLDVEGWGVPAAIVTTVILAPVGEELVYRYFLGSVTRCKSKWVSVLICTGAFALMHMNPYQTLYPLVLGLALSLVWSKTGNTAYTIGMHAFNNGLALLLGIVFPTFTYSLSEWWGWLIAVGCLFLAVCGVVWLSRSFTEDVSRPQTTGGKGGWWTYALAAGMCLGLWLTSCIPT